MSAMASMWRHMAHTRIEFIATAVQIPGRMWFLVPSARDERDPSTCEFKDCQCRTMCPAAILPS
ncbi:hypothetical protein BRAS3843_1580014 [Bradyrhizobium sp. STM 3843]|nr:hypothetical protein BRAS3843_1580014 [Bradyrhizobium sp. STM 3843]